MSTVKTDMLALLETLPEDATWEDLQYAIYVRQKIERARRDVTEGHTFSSGEARERMSKWTEPFGGPSPR